MPRFECELDQRTELVEIPDDLAENRNGLSDIPESRLDVRQSVGRLCQ